MGIAGVLVVGIAGAASKRCGKVTVEM